MAPLARGIVLVAALAALLSLAGCAWVSVRAEGTLDDVDWMIAFPF